MGDTRKKPPANDVLGAAGDRRKHKRFLPRACDMTLIPEARGFLKLFGSAKKSVARAVVDLSEGGARFVTSTQMPVGRRVQISIFVKLFKDTIETQGLVAWCSAHPNRASSYYVGICFDRIDPGEARKINSIREYLNSPEFRQKESTRLRLRPDLDGDSIQYDI